MSELSIVIVNWNQTETTRESLRRCADFRRVRPVVWVVDNDSEDGGWRRLEQEFPAVRVLRSERNLGYGGGNNLALRRIDSEYVLLLNNDAALAEADLERLLGAIGADERLAVLGPLVVESRDGAERVAAGGRDVARYPRTHLRPTDLEPGRLESERPFPVDYVPGVAALVRVAALEEIGLLEEAYFFGGELADFCWRARRGGWSVQVLPTATARHDTDLSSRHRGSLYPYYILRNRFLFVRRCRRLGRAPWFVFWTIWGLAAVARELLGGRPARARQLLLALLDGLTGRFGGQNERVLG